MKLYIAKHTITIRAGVLRLSAEQARCRLHNLRQLGNGRFEITAAIMFKSGEEFAYEGDLPKSLAGPMGSEAPSKSRSKSGSKSKSKSKVDDDADSQSDTDPNPPPGLSNTDDQQNTGADS